MMLRQRLQRFRLLPDRPEIGWAPHLYLIYLVYLFFPPVFDPSAGFRDWLAVGLMIVVFLPLYYRGYWLPNRASLINAWLIALLGIIGCLINTGAVVFFIYAAAAIASAAPPKAAWWHIALICLIIIVQAFYVAMVFSPYALISFGFGIAFVLIIGAQCVYDAERRRQNAKLRLAQEEVENLAKIAERERIARDLHDLLGHTLSMITLKSELASKLIERNPERAAQEMREVERISREALAEVRSAVTGYRAKGFQAELLNARHALETADIHFEYFAERVELTPIQEGVVALALREAVTNVIRHAQASRCAVRLRYEQGQIMLEVQDDGSGNIQHEGSGLSGMRERVGSIGGSITIKPQNGTRLILTLPSRVTTAEPNSPTVMSLNEARAL
jgi:two-component system sensor histidine kinase DesK